jgi:hypothetical protein
MLSSTSGGLVSTAYLWQSASYVVRSDGILRVRLTSYAHRQESVIERSDTG